VDAADRRTELERKEFLDRDPGLDMGSEDVANAGPCLVQIGEYLVDDQAAAGGGERAAGDHQAGVNPYENIAVSPAQATLAGEQRGDAIAAGGSDVRQSS